MSGSLLNGFHSHDVVRSIEFVDVLSDSRVVLEVWVRVLLLVVEGIETCFISGLEHDVSWDVKDIKWLIWSGFDDKLKWLEVSRWDASFGSGVHTIQPVVFRLVDIGELGQEELAVGLDALLALLQQLDEHIIVIDKGGNAIRKDNTIHLLTDAEILIKDVVADKLKLVD